MWRGVRGELIRQPWLQNWRRSPQQADQFVYGTYAAGIVLALILGLLPGAVGTLLSVGVGIGLCYLYFAIGTKRANQFVAYGVCAVGAVLGTLSAIFTIAALVDVLSLRLTAGLTVMLLLSLGVTVLAVAVLVYVGLQVHRGIQRIWPQTPPPPGTHR